MNLRVRLLIDDHVGCGRRRIDLSPRRVMNAEAIGFRPLSNVSRKHYSRFATICFTLWWEHLPENPFIIVMSATSIESQQPPRVFQYVSSLRGEWFNSSGSKTKGMCFAFTKSLLREQRTKACFIVENFPWHM
ncbi:hypothetical protein NPIL_392171 [Nephila pilipes]|uniref:Uncharacterized protein n=1 Tax=Nephila pilipes TaxID=299642 RepID=A0A8X6N8M6_NEPPI|nr:hypothetical protein NPIL_392171 [Nephila pilipes]